MLEPCFLGVTTENGIIHFEIHLSDSSEEDVDGDVEMKHEDDDRHIRVSERVIVELERGRFKSRKPRVIQIEYLQSETFIFATAQGDIKVMSIVEDKVCGLTSEQSLFLGTMCRFFGKEKSLMVVLVAPSDWILEQAELFLGIALGKHSLLRLENQKCCGSCTGGVEGSLCHIACFLIPESP